MIQVIDNGGFAHEKSWIESLLLPQDATFILDESGHTITFNNERFKLNFFSTEFQQLLSSPHPLLIAAGRTKGKLLDACGGLGKDSFIFTHHRFDVTTCEISPIIYLLLSHAVSKYTLATTLKWKTHLGAAQELMTSQSFDIIYLDPMFQKKRTSKPKLGMQMLQVLAENSPFTSWEMAWEQAKQRLIIKNYAKTPPVSELPTPSFQVKGKRSIRYDVYIKDPV